MVRMKNKTTKVVSKRSRQKKEKRHPRKDLEHNADLEPFESDDEKEERPLKDKDERNEAEKGKDDDKSDEGSDDGLLDKSEPKDHGPLFSDENAAWLKPKNKSKLFDDSEDKIKSGKAQIIDDDDDDDDDDDADDDDADEDLLEIERESRRVDQEMEEEKQEAEEEMRRTISQQTSLYHLPTAGELDKDADRVVPPSEYRTHIESILEVLAEFKTRRESGRSRKEYIDVLCHFIAELYGYLPELVEYFLSMFGPTEALEFIDASDKPRPLVIRTNTLKVRRKDLAAALIKRGVSLDPLANWSKVGLKIVESPVPIGATPEYLGGHYMLQSAASMCPVLALGPEPQDKVLDMAAAPGGKTSYIAQLMKNTGVIVANDLKKERQKATVANMHRLGVKNVITCTHDGRKMGTIFKNRFDRILLDAPCSGLGVISRDPSVKVQRTIADVNQCAHLQKELLLAAIDALKFKGTKGAVMVYSTCSVSIAENEEVVNYALSKRDIRLVETGLDFGNPGYTRFQQKRFHPSLAMTRRFYPHVHNMDGFYVAKIEKLSDNRPGSKPEDADNEKEEKDELDDDDDDINVEGGGAKKQDTGTKQEKGKEGGSANNKSAKSTSSPDEAAISRKRTLQVSVPPKQAKPKKQRQNAKVTKPRRPKKDGM
ncbi:hypothetical protein ACA910_021737 [Epithemia clementina (nom. ined.)]